MRTALILAAHPDDEVLGCGGTVARMATDGWNVRTAIFGEGITSRSARRTDASRQELEQLQSNARQAARILGVPEPQFFDLPDNRFDTIPLLDLVKPIERLISELRPEIVFTQHGGDLNIDHVQLFRATLTATRPMAGTPVKAVYAYEVASSSEWAFQQFEPSFRPNVFRDIGLSLERKIAAMQAYEGESRQFPHPRSPEALRAQAVRWGAVAGLTAAEAFQLVREVL